MFNRYKHTVYIIIYKCKITVKFHLHPCMPQCTTSLLYMNLNSKRDTCFKNLEINLSPVYVIVGLKHGQAFLTSTQQARSSGSLTWWLFADSLTVSFVVINNESVWKICRRRCITFCIVLESLVMVPCQWHIYASSFTPFLPDWECAIVFWCVQWDFFFL